MKSTFYAISTMETFSSRIQTRLTTNLTELRNLDSVQHKKAKSPNFKWRVAINDKEKNEKINNYS